MILTENQAIISTFFSRAAGIGSHAGTVQDRYISLDGTALENDASKINEASRQETAEKGEQIEKAYGIESKDK